MTIAHQKLMHVLRERFVQTLKNQKRRVRNAEYIPSIRSQFPSSSFLHYSALFRRVPTEYGCCIV